MEEMDEEHRDGRQLLIIKTRTIHSNKCAYIPSLSNMDARKDKVAGNFTAIRIKAKHLFNVSASTSIYSEFDTMLFE